MHGCHSIISYVTILNFIGISESVSPVKFSEEIQLADEYSKLDLACN